MKMPINYKVNPEEPPRGTLGAQRFEKNLRRLREGAIIL